MNLVGQLAVAHLVIGSLSAAPDDTSIGFRSDMTAMAHLYQKKAISRG